MDSETEEPTPLADDHELNLALATAQADARRAIAWYDTADGVFPAPLAVMREALEQNQLLASDELGERGFVVDATNARILFNSRYLDGVVRSTTETFLMRYGRSPEAAAVSAQQAVGLYMFHELFHISQNFIDHELAGVIKEAFGPDELSKFDVYADVIAAHCQTLVDLLEKAPNLDNYLPTYGAYLTLSYDVLTGAFELSPHKKKRALGLITSRMLVERALWEGETGGDVADLALSPVYTSIAEKSGHIIALVGRDHAWEILFYARAENPMDLLAVWEAAGKAPPSDVLALLFPFYEQVVPRA